MPNETIEKILDLARWAPSGDNTQPWRFEIVPDSRIAVHGFDTRRSVLYDFDGHASHMAHGALLETLRLAATRFGLRAEWSARAGCPDEAPIYDVTLTPAAIAEDPLVRHIETRTVQRRAMRATPLAETQKDALAAAVGERYTLRFLASPGERLAVARMLWQSAGIRLTCPEAYPVHRDIIEWNARYSADRIPDAAVGVDPATALLMRWVMRRWERVAFFNRWLGGTIVPRAQLDFIPGLACASHILMRPAEPPAGFADHVRAGAALQRLWLTAASLGLHLQPEMTPLIFRWYARAGREFSAHPGMANRARALAARFEGIAGAGENDAFSFFCRVGHSRPPRSRSIRKTLRELLRNGVH
ncbi:MAG: nitroreductase family protein [Candidatus Accumulibacter sp.]|jgi:nitroreductase|nr:nitroreductase family protein [Accumulibacter sp.]